MFLLFWECEVIGKIHAWRNNRDELEISTISNYFTKEIFRH